MGELRSVMRGEFIALSFGISFAGAYCGINTCEQFRLSTREKSKLLNRQVLKFLMAISIGGVAIWSMHFVGMSSVSFVDSDGNSVDVRYRKDYTLLSLVAAIIFCYAGIHICSTDAAFKIDRVDTMDEFIRGAALMSIPEIKNMHSASYIMISALFKGIHRLVIGGFVTAAGVCIMHYLGMSAIITDAKIEYDVGIVAASVLIAMIAATAGYWILFRLLALYPHVELLRLMSSFVVAIAVNGMHYTGMAATKFIYLKGNAASYSNSMSVASESAVTGSLIASMVFLLANLLMTIADLRAWFYTKSRTERVADAIIRSLLHIQNPDATIREAIAKYDTLRGKSLVFSHSSESRYDFLPHQIVVRDTISLDSYHFSRYKPTSVAVINDVEENSTDNRI